jgi:hypothetical protein
VRRENLLGIAVALLLLVLGCSDGRRYDQAVAILIDVSGTYADERGEVVKIIKRDVLPALVPGDTLAVIRIDSESYQKENLELLMTLDQRPSHANAQKLAAARKLDAFARRPGRSDYTDIPGAMMLAAEYLREIAAGSRVMLVFSDMREDLPKGSSRKLAETEFQDIRVVAMNVKRLDSDNADPELFRGRLARWERDVTRSGAAEWHTFMDATKLTSYLADVR